MKRTSDRALPKFAQESEGSLRITPEPPLTTRISQEDWDALARALDGYLHTISNQWARMLGGYTLVDIAQRVVGVGSVGLRAYIALLQGSTPTDVIFLQLKQARRSVLAQYVHGSKEWHSHQGERVVEYQRALQTVSDPLLGWASVGGAAILCAPVPQYERNRSARSVGRQILMRLCGNRGAAAGSRTRAHPRRRYDCRLPG